MPKWSTTPSHFLFVHITIYLILRLVHLSALLFSIGSMNPILVRNRLRDEEINTRESQIKLLEPKTV